MLLQDTPDGIQVPLMTNSIIVSEEFYSAYLEINKTTIIETIDLREDGFEYQDIAGDIQLDNYEVQMCCSNESQEKFIYVPFQSQLYICFSIFDACEIVKNLIAVEKNKIIKCTSSKAQ